MANTPAPETRSGRGQRNPDFYDRARQIFQESDGSCTDQYILRQLWHEGYVTPTPAEMRLYMGQWVASDIGFAPVANRLLGSHRQIKTGSRVLKHIERYVEDGDVEGVQRCFVNHVDLSNQIVEKLMMALPEVEIKDVAEVRALVDLAQRAAQTATDLRDYIANAKAEAARPVQAPGDPAALDGEILPPASRNAVDLSEALERFQKRA